jgi:hypothetical protein
MYQCQVRNEDMADKMLLYFMKVLESYRCLPFVLVYCQSGITDDNSPDISFVQTIFDMFTAR